MSLDITTLALSVSSTGIKEAATALEALSVAASKVEAKAKTVKEATSGLSASQQKQSENIEKLIAKFERQATLMGANTSQQNAYAVAMKNGTELERKMAMMLGAEVDAYKAKGAAQAKAVADNRALDASYKQLQKQADAYYAAQVKAQSAGNTLNQAGQREQELRKLAEAQRVLTRTTNELAAAEARQKAIQQRRDMDVHTRSTLSYANAQAEAIRMNNALDAAARRAAGGIHESNGAMRDAHGFARGLSGSLGALWLTYGSILPLLAGVAIGASMKEAVKGFAAVEYQMTFVKALAEDTTNSVHTLTQAMHGIAGALGIAPESAAKGLRALTQAGLSTTEALSTLPTAFKLATVGELDLGTAALAATGVMNAYALRVTDIEHIGDVMAKAGAMSAASVDSISVSMKYSAGTAEQYGVSMEKLAATLTLLGKRGITGSSAGVAANNLIAELYSPSSEKAIKAAAALGVKAYVDGVRQPLEDVVKSFKDGLGKFDAEGQGAILEAYFGKKGGKAFYALAQGTKEEFKSIEDQLINSTGFVAGVYKANLATTQGQFNLMTSAIKNAFAKVGEESSAPIKELMVSIRNLANNKAVLDMFVGLTQSIKTFVTVVVPAAAAIGSFFLAAKIGAGVMAAWTGAMAFAQSAITIGLIPAIKALNIAMLANPVGLLIGAITLLAGAYFLLKRDIQSVHQLHETDMKHAADTLRAGEEEIKMLEKKLSLRQRDIRGDAEDAALKEMKALEGVQAIQQKIVDNNTLVYGAAGKNRGATVRGSGVDNSLGKELEAAGAAERENKQLEKDLAVATKMYDATAAQNKKVLELKRSLHEEDKRLDAQALADRAKDPVGTQRFGKEPAGAKAAASDAYTAALTKHADDIRASKTAMQNFEDTQNNLFRSGEIGKLKFIQEVGNKQVEELGKQRAAIQAQLALAQGKKNGQADVANYTGDLAANTVAANTAKVKLAEETNVQLAKYEEDATRFRITQLEIQGKYGEAAALRFSSDNKMAFKQAEQDLMDFGNTFPIITERYAQMKAAQAAAISKGYSKEASNAFLDEAERVRNSLKGIQTASEGLGLAAMLNAATAASKELADSIPKMEALKGGITDPTQLNEANAQLINLAENQRKLWAGVGESISRSLGDAFGNAGKAAGELLMVSINTGNVETKLAADKAAAIRSTEAAHREFGFSQYDTAKALNKINLDYASKEKSVRIKAYGDMAGAAKGFFKEGSTGYKLLGAAEKAFRAMEFALAIKSFVMKSGMLTTLFGLKVATDAGSTVSDTAHTGIALANSGARATAKGIEAVINQGASGDPYTAAARMAGMAATVAALGIVMASIGGGGGGSDTTSEDRQKSQGTGSVLGAPTIYNKDGTVSIAGAKSESIVNSLSILEKNSGLGLAHSNSMVHYLKSVSDNIKGLSAALMVRAGVDITKGPDDYVNGGTIGKISNSIFGGNRTTLDTGIATSKDSLRGVLAGSMNAVSYNETKKDGGWFHSDKYSTNMKTLGAETNSQFTKIILGMSDSIKAAANDIGVGGSGFTTRLESFVVDIGKISAKGLTGAEVQKELEAAFGKLGDDMARFAIAGLDKFQLVGEGYLETVVRVANNLIQVQDVFAVLGKTFSLTGVAAINVSESLITAAGGLDKLTEGTKYFVDNFLTEAERMGPITNSVNKRLAELNLTGITSTESFSKLVRSLDLTDPASQRLYGSLLELAPAFKESADYAQDLLDGTVALTKAQQKALDAVEKAKSNLQEAYNAERDSLQGVIDKTKAFIGTLKSYQDGLKLGADSPLTNMQKYAEARKQFDATAAAANGGDQAAKDKFTGAASALLAASKTINASGDGYTSDFNMVQNMIDTLMGSATSQVDVATASLNALNAQVLGLIDVNKSVMSVTQAITELQKAITLGGIAGLSNKQMDTTYTPTPAQVAAATPTGTQANQMAPAVPLIVKGLEIIGNKIDGLRTEQAAQTGALVQASHESANANAEDTVEGLEGLSGMIGRVVRKVALV